MDTTTKIPRGNEEFMEAYRKFKDDISNFDLAAECCKKCSRDIDCEECYIQTVADLQDPYRSKIQERTRTGMYSSGMYVDKDGVYHYSTPQGTG